MKKYLKEIIYYLAHRILWILFYIPSIKLKILLLRICGATIGKNVSVHIGVKIIAPWNLIIGNNSTINSSCFLDCRGLLTIGNNTMIGYSTSIHTAGHHYKSKDFPMYKNKVSIGRNTIIFPKCFIGPGANIENDCTLLPMTVLLKGTYSRGSVMLGNPSRRIGSIEDIERGSQFHNSPFGF